MIQGLGFPVPPPSWYGTPDPGSPRPVMVWYLRPWVPPSPSWSGTSGPWSPRPPSSADDVDTIQNRNESIGFVKGFVKGDETLCFCKVS